MKKAKKKFMVAGSALAGIPETAPTAMIGRRACVCAGSS